MSKYARIVDHTNLVRDLYSKSILNTDISVVKKHEKRINDLQKEHAREVEINSLKKDVTEIKEMLQALLSSRE